MKTRYLQSAIKQFQYYRQLGDRTFEQLEDQQLFWAPNSQSNSIAVIVGHLQGNMLSRWTNFLTEDGEKAWRTRDAEFEASISDRKELVRCWNEGWNCLFEAIEELTDQDMERIIYIRNQGHTVAEAINRQLCHYAYHVGQITYLGRMQLGNRWNSLSIPKGASKAYNAAKFSKPPSEEHFTDELLDGNREA